MRLVVAGGCMVGGKVGARASQLNGRRVVLGNSAPEQGHGPQKRRQ